MKGNALWRLLRTTDAKQIGLLYLITSFGYFIVGGILALIIRVELARPGMQVVSPSSTTRCSPCTAR